MWTDAQLFTLKTIHDVLILEEYVCDYMLYTQYNIYMIKKVCLIQKTTNSKKK